MHISSDDDLVLKLLDDFDVRTINICVPLDNHGEWMNQHEAYRSISHRHRGRFAWITSFDLPRFDDAGYCQAVIEQLEKDFADGAVAVKIWKNVGMVVKKPNGDFLQMDDPLYQPIWDYLIKLKKPLLGHLADPLQCWLPLTEKGAYCSYYRKHPEWHMYTKPDFPHHSEIMAARDRVLEKNPGLQFVGAHLGSMEYDLDEVARRLDAYPNFAVDTSARFWSIALQDRDKVIRFFDRYQDRVLFGIDSGVPGGLLAEPDLSIEDRVNSIRSTYEMEFQYFETDGMIDLHGDQIQGIKLPESIQRKFYWENAMRWYPGVF